MIKSGSDNTEEKKGFIISIKVKEKFKQSEINEDMINT